MFQLHGSPHVLPTTYLGQEPNININDVNNINAPSDTKVFYDHLMSRFSNFDDDQIDMTKIIVPCEYYDIENMNNHGNFGLTHATIHMNIESLPAKLDQLSMMITRLEQRKICLNFILLCETFVNDNNQNLCNIEGYTLICRNRINRKKGGVAIYVKNDIHFKHRPDIELNIDCEFESIFIEATLNNSTFIVGEIYRIPNSNELESVTRFETILNKLSKIKNNIIIGCDQNFDLLQIDTRPSVSALLDNFLAAGLIPTIDKPTRVVHKSSTLIDNIYIKFNTNEYKPNESSILMTYISDHFPILLTYESIQSQHKQETPLFIKTRMMNDKKMNNINKSLDQINWNLLINDDIEGSFSRFIASVNAAINLHAPEREIKINAKKIIRNPWITAGLIKSSKTLDKLFSQQKDKPQHHPLKVKYKSYKNAYNKLKRLRKNAYYTNMIENVKNDIRKTWQILNNLVGKRNDKSTIPKQFINNGSYITDPQMIANDFSTYFSQVGEQFASAIPPATKHFETYLNNVNINKSFFMSPTDPNEIDNIITSLKAKKSCGVDGVSTEFIKKKAKHVLKLPISLLTNLSIETGYVPKILKIAKVIPIYKNKNPELYTNYRPISLLPSLSKIIEKVVHKRLYHFLNSQHILYDSQYGFRPKRSTIQAITQLTAHILDTLDNKQHSICVFLDLSKAFDTINHATLLVKLHKYGVRGLALEWFKSYLSNRKQFVKFNNIVSSESDVSCGVPQGSVLGPLLFILYTNDLPCALRDSKCILFADDTTIYMASNNINEIITSITNDMTLLTDWFRANKLSLNVSKTNYMVFTNTPHHIPQFSLYIENKLLNRVENVKFLGIHIDHKLDWGTHIQKCKNKILSGLYALRNVRNLLLHSHMKSLYYTLIHPHITYGTMLWGSAKKIHLKKIQVLQNKAIRVLTNTKYNESALPLYKLTKILPLNDIYQFQLALCMYQLNNKQLSRPLQALFTINIDIHSYNTRHHLDPHITKRRTQMIIKSFLHKIPEFWYILPRDVKKVKSVCTFKSRMKRFLGY